MLVILPLSAPREIAFQKYTRYGDCLSLVLEGMRVLLGWPPIWRRGTQKLYKYHASVIENTNKLNTHTHTHTKPAWGCTHKALG
jgi:hypothetical protein